MEIEFREFSCWLWGRNSLYWHQNIRIRFPIKFLIKFQTFWCQFDFLYANGSGKIINHKNKTSGTSMEHFANTSHDDILKLIDKSKNKKMAKATAACMNLYHTWAKTKRRSAWIRKGGIQKTWRNFTTFFLRNWKSTTDKIMSLILYVPNSFLNKIFDRRISSWKWLYAFNS